jgi:enoyl-CoA hydratase
MIEFSQRGDVAVLTIDDGKANAVGNAFVDALNAALDRAEKEAKAVVVAGRTGVFSGGFDLKEFQKGPEATTALVGRGARLLLRVFSHPQPIVAACTGHAVATGAFLLLAADTRIGTSGPFRIGLNETAIGMTLPVFGLELAKARLSRRYLMTALVQAHLFDPEGAKDAGFLDAVSAPDELLDSALARATALAALPGAAYAANKLALRTDSIAAIRASL